MRHRIDRVLECQALRDTRFKFIRPRDRRWGIEGIAEISKRVEPPLDPAKLLGFGKLKEVASLVTPQTLLAWHRNLSPDGNAEESDWFG